MESILEQLGLETLLERFSSEKVDPEVVLSMSESSLIRLGVETVGDRIRIKERCKQYVEGDKRGTSFTSSSPAQQIAEERRMLFQPYSSHRGQGSRTAKADKRKKSSRRTWTGQFVCLADRQACRVPSSTEKQILQEAGLGLKKIKFFVDDSEEEVLQKLTSDTPGEDGQPAGFPQLKEGKGFELMSCITNSRDLAVVKSSWSVERLKALFTPQTKIYLRPIQKNLRTKGRKENSATCKLKEKCIWCSQEIALTELRSHLVSCSCNVFDDNLEDEVLVSSDKSSHVSESLMPNSATRATATVSRNELEALSTGPNDIFSPPAVSVVTPGSVTNPGLTLSSMPPDSGNLTHTETGPLMSEGSPSVIVPSFVDNSAQATHQSDSTTDQLKTDDLKVDIEVVVPEIIEYCHSTGNILH